ncbi:MAG: 3D domain-containing protein [Candidatus Daviesbacteria bacterium]
MKTLFGALLVLAALFIHFYLPSFQSPPPPVKAENVLGSSTEPLPPIKTESRFSEKLIENSEGIKRKTIYKDNPEGEAGTDEVLEEGADGKKTTITKITYYKTDTSEVGFDSSEVDLGKEYSREIVGTEVTDPKDKIISRGTKIIWKTLETPEGEIRYWKKMRVYATHYDHNCPGCNEWTATGAKATKGVVAVDPKVIKMGTRMYIPGYGPGVAADTGGAIKGNIIDLCFEDAKTAGWRAHFIDIYLID